MSTEGKGWPGRATPFSLPARLRRRAAILLFAAGLVGFAARGASADPLSDTGPNGEQVTVGMTLDPLRGPFYSSGGVPAALRIEVGVTAPYDPLRPPAENLIFPSKQGRVSFPPDLTFHPKRSMPVCTDARMNATTNLSIPPSEAIGLCPRSVIGNGTAALYLANQNRPAGPFFKDVVLVIFHAGWTGAGRPKVKIYGFSKGVNTGLLMQGVLAADNSITIDVPMLPVDSAIGRYDLNVPARVPISYEGKPVAGSKGLDPSYVMARCSTGSWPVSAASVLGTRKSDGSPLSPDYSVAAPDITVPCSGLSGAPPVARLAVNGPATVKRGVSSRYRVRIRNYRGVDVTGVRLVVSGEGVRSGAAVGRIPAGEAKAVPLRLRFRRAGRPPVTFRVTGRGVGPASAIRTVTVR